MIAAFLSLHEVEKKICDISAEHLVIRRDKVLPSSSLIEDLGCDSLDLVELVMTIEEAFGVTLPDGTAEPVYKSVFTRRPFCLSDLAELVYLQQGTGAPEREGWRNTRPPAPGSDSVPFTQLSGVWDRGAVVGQPLFEKLGSDGEFHQFRRRSDGMRCVRIPAATVEIGSSTSQADEWPMHRVEMESFLIDSEPVSTTAYCRFLNTIGDIDRSILADWLLLDEADDRIEQMVITRAAERWRPVPGAERWPVVLVSWYGANAYSLWANDHDWRTYRDDGPDRNSSFLPSEVQFEYAARGSRYREYPWGDERPDVSRMRYGQHRRGVSYTASTMPMAAVNERLGVSPFGLHHMAGNVWQWCRDWYGRDFYRSPAASEPDALNRTPTGIRSERGGSWIGPAVLCRSSFRRGRPPAVMGRCLGFRCVSDPR